MRGSDALRCVVPEHGWPVLYKGGFSGNAGASHPCTRRFLLYRIVQILQQPVIWAVEAREVGVDSDAHEILIPLQICNSVRVQHPLRINV